MTAQAIQYLPHENCAQVAAVLGHKWDDEEEREGCDEYPDDVTYWHHPDDGSDPVEIFPGDWIVNIDGEILIGKVPPPGIDEGIWEQL